MSETVSRFARALEKRLVVLLTDALDDETDITVRVGDETDKFSGRVVTVRAEEGRQVHPRLNVVEVRLNVVLRAKAADVNADSLNDEWCALCGLLDDGEFATLVAVPDELTIYGVKIAPFTHETEDNCFKKRWTKQVVGFVPIAAPAP
jgi:hypothetical protein